MSYNIDLGGWGSVFAVPSSVVDSGLKLATENQLKVLLYILRHSDSQLTDDSVAQALSLHPEDVIDSIEYWTQKGLFVRTSECLTISDTPVSSNVAVSDTPATANAVEDTARSSAPKSRLLSRPTKPEPAYVTKRLKGDKTLVYLMNEAERILSKPLSNSDVATLVMLHDTDGLPVEVMLMLLEHCVRIGKGNMRYIERTGIGWGSDGITTIALAEEKIRRYSESTDAWRVVATVFGIRIGTPTAKQREFSDNWINQWKFNEDMLRLAYERCVDLKGEMSMSYINGILRRWHDGGIVNAEQVKLEDEAKRSKASRKKKNDSDNKASYDIDEYENFSIFDD